MSSTVEQKHVGVEYTICFEKPTGLFPDLGLRHSADNYYRTLCHNLGVSDCPCHLEGPDEPDLKYC